MPVPVDDEDGGGGGGVFEVDPGFSFETFDAEEPPPLPVLDVDERDTEAGGERSEDTTAFDERGSSNGGRAPPLTRGAGWCFALGLLSSVGLRLLSEPLAPCPLLPPPPLALALLPMPPELLLWLLLECQV